MDMVIVDIENGAGMRMEGVMGFMQDVGCGYLGNLIMSAKI